MKWLKRRFKNVWIPVGVVLSLVLTSFSGISFVQPGQVEAEETKEISKELSNPVIVPDRSMVARQKVTWGCIWFGSYPQAEVIPAGSEYTALSEELLQEGDLIRDDTLYQTLQSATGWDEQGDIVISGEKYRRITKEDATYTYTASSSVRYGYYNWKNKTEYHYFKYQPIKWRVLSVNGSEVFLLADKVLDDKKYHTKRESVTWKESTIRSWLNGYNASANIQNQDYSSDNFIDTAFGISGQQAIKETYVESKDILDKVFLLSESETHTGRYGFVSRYNYTGEYGYVSGDDEARRAVSSVYAKSMGTHSSISASYAGSCHWWLRSPVYKRGNEVPGVDSNGYVQSAYRLYVDNDKYGVRPALNLNLITSPDVASSNFWSYAGTVCSDGTVNEIKPESTPEASPSAEPPEIPEADKKLSNPRIVPDSSMEAGQKVIWDCVWFGSYPQAEVVPTGSEYTALPEELLQEGDLIQDDSLYQTLQSATGWDEQGDIVIGDEKYRRITEENSTLASIDYGYYNWKNKIEYHYFKYQPIKWRVLSVNGSEAFLLADKALDSKQYYTFEDEFDDVTWEGSIIRSWLNGYNASANIQNQDYSSKNFIDTAFGISEQQAIKETYVENKDNLEWDTDCGNDTHDKVFLLSESETYTDIANGYGFVSGNLTRDEARRTFSSVYAKAMGTYSSTSASNATLVNCVGNCLWWLRSSGYSGWYAVIVDCDGWVDSGFNYVDNYGYGVRPALKLNLTALPDTASSNLWSHAGTVCSDGTVSDKTVNEIKPEVDPSVKQSSKPQDVIEVDKKLSNPCIESNSNEGKGYKVTWDCVWFGSYPQAEVVSEDVRYKALKNSVIEKGGLIKDNDLYNALQNETNWDEFGDAEINGEKYRRITSEDAKNVTYGDYNYNWGDNNTTFHYFKYKPIKWKVLSVNDSEAFLLADRALDCRKYNEEREDVIKDVKWEGSTIRSWLNGYDCNENIKNISYLKNNFINIAFNMSEQSAIKDSYVKNKTPIGGKDTKDKIFLLSKSDINEEEINKYGFFSNKEIESKSSVFAKAMGTYCSLEGNCMWWLRSNSYNENAVVVNPYGMIYDGRSESSAESVRPVLNLSINTSSDTITSNCYCYAGTVCSDGTVNEISPTVTPGNTPGEVPTTKPGEEPGNTPGEAPAVKPGEDPGNTPGTDTTTKPGEDPGNTPGADTTAKPDEEPGNTPGADTTAKPGEKPENMPTPATPFIPYNVPSGGGSVNVPTQTPDSTVLPTVSPAPTDVPVVPQTPKPAETGSSPVPETDNKPSQTNAPGSTAKPDEETGNNSNIDNSDIDNSNTNNTNNSCNIKISKGSMVTDKKTKAVYKVIKNGKKNTVQYINNTKKNASSVTIPNKIKINGKSYKVDSIGKGAFKNNKKLKKVKIGKNIKTIGKGAFVGCKNLTDVEIGENVTEIKENAFSKCTSLVMVTIPAKVNKIGNRAFYKCKNLQYILVKSNKLMESNIGKEVFSGGFSTPRIKTDKSKWELYQKIFTARGMSQKALYIIDPVKLVP